MTNKYLPYIDGMRGISILAVVVFHLFPQSFPNGYAGVDVFFVISGFLITGLILREQESGELRLKAFYARRIRRIFPALFVVIISCLIVGGVTLSFSELQALGKHAVAGSFFSSNILLWLESGYFDSESKLKPFLHLWSLGVEEQFYLLWPLLLVLFKGTGKRFLFPLVISLSLVAYIYTFFQNPSAAFYLLPFRMWQLGLGAYLSNLGRRESIIPGLLSLIGLLVVLFQPLNVPQVLTILLATFSSAGVILFSGSSLLSRVLTVPFLIPIGKISYPLYLWHWPLVSFLYLKNISMTPLMSFSVLLISVILGTMTYLFIEKPFSANFPLKRISEENRLLLLGSLVMFLPLLFFTKMNRNPGSQSKELANFKNYQPPLYKSGKCFLEHYMNQNDFDPACLEVNLAKKVFIWGDSISTQFYLPLKKMLPENHGLTTLSSSLCPPLVGFVIKERPNCSKVNKYFFALIQKHRPDYLILLSNWYYYADSELNGRLEETIRLSKEAGVKSVILVGQIPYWKKPLYQLMEEKLGENKITEIPEFNSEDLKELLFNMDIHLENIALNSGAHFAPILREVCRNGACPVTFEGSNPKNLSSFDAIHPTPVAARIYTQLIMPYIRETNSGSKND